ncbi:MAG: heat-inducible transcriptional repressor HrcA [Capsulimonadaceae bacterium]
MELGDRKCKILGAVVRDYVETVRPVGSEELAARYSDWGVKSATIRNELAELAELGYLRQPHTSAGRIPSDQGYRFYVDNLLDTDSQKDLGPASEPAIDSTLELESLLRHTCVLLARITSYTSVATPPRPADTSLSRIFLTPVSRTGLLAAVLLSTGKIENRFISTGPGDHGARTLHGAGIDALTNAINAWLGGLPLEQIKSITAGAVEAAAPPDLTGAARVLWTSVAHAVLHAVREITDSDQVVLEGTMEIFKQPEFRDATKIESVLVSLQRGAVMLQMLPGLRAHLTVVIGSENHVAAMRECSVVTAPYFVGTRLRGTIGVVGPTRMNYDRAIPAVDLFATSLSNTLTDWRS